MLMGPTKYSKTPTDLRVGKYANGEIALYTIEDSGEIALKLTVNLEGVGPLPPAGHVWLKGWSENEGVPAAVEAAGIAKLTGRTHHCAHDAYVQEAELSAATLAWIEEGDSDGC